MEFAGTSSINEGFHHSSGERSANVDEPLLSDWRQGPYLSKFDERRPQPLNGVNPISEVEPTANIELISNSGTGRRQRKWIRGQFWQWFAGYDARHDIDDEKEAGGDCINHAPTSKIRIRDRTPLEFGKSAICGSEQHLG